MERLKQTKVLGARSWRAVWCVWACLVFAACGGRDEDDDRSPGVEVVAEDPVVHHHEQPGDVMRPDMSGVGEEPGASVDMPATMDMPPPLIDSGEDMPEGDEDDMGAGGEQDMEEPVVVIDPSDEPNFGWIGGHCEAASQCDFEQSMCLGQADGFAQGGVCSQACDRYCPDRDGTNSVTFCVATGQGGRCMPRCDFGLFPQSGCRDDLVCRVMHRNQDPTTSVPTCVSPQEMAGSPLSACMGTIGAQGTTWSSWAYMTQSPAGEPSYQCTIDDPIKVDPVINGVSYTYYNQSSPRAMYVSCELASALHELGDILKQYDIVEVLHIGTFNCRKISGKDKLSQHSYGRAIDIWGFVDRTGERYVLEDHWEHDTDTPQSHKARVLYDIAQQMHQQKIFHNILTPNYNAGHDNHFHVDLEPGALFIGASRPPSYYLGSEGWEDRCGSHDH